MQLPLQVLKHKSRNATYEAQDSFLSHGIRADTRTPWNFANGWDYLSDPEDASQYPPTDSRFSPPNIGFYGYSRSDRFVPEDTS